MFHTLLSLDKYFTIMKFDIRCIFMFVQIELLSSIDILIVYRLSVCVIVNVSKLMKLNKLLKLKETQLNIFRTEKLNIEWVERTIYRHCKLWEEACVIIHQFTFCTSHLLSAEKMLLKKGVGTFITSSITCK